MKLFRRIFALTMVIAMVCLLSTSAFAAASEDRFSQPLTFNGMTVAGAWGQIYDTTFQCEVYTTGVDAIRNYFRIEAAYVCKYLGPDNAVYYPRIAYAEAYDEFSLYMETDAIYGCIMDTATICFDATVAVDGGVASVSYDADTIRYTGP